MKLVLYLTTSCAINVLVYFMLKYYYEQKGIIDKPPPLEQTLKNFYSKKPVETEKQHPIPTPLNVAMKLAKLQGIVLVAIWVVLLAAIFIG